MINLINTVLDNIKNIIIVILLISNMVLVLKEADRQIKENSNG